MRSITKRIIIIFTVVTFELCNIPWTETAVRANQLITLSGVAHIQDLGDTAGTWDEATGILTLGTRGQSRRVEAITIDLENNTGLSGSIEYRVHVQDIGWQDYRNAGEMAGTEGQAKRLEGIEMILTGDLAEYYSVVYCVHIQDYGDAQGWVSDGALAGTTGEAKRLEEVQVKLVPKYQGTATDVNYRVHRQDYGWESCWKTNGESSGTTGEAKRLEGIEIHLSGLEYPGGIRYKTHVQNIGWESDWSYDGEMSGTQGLSYRLEAIQIELYGEIALEYDVYYRVHAQDYGWLGWAKNGEISGTSGLAKRLEAIQIILVKKGNAAPDSVLGVVSDTDAIAVTDEGYFYSNLITTNKTICLKPSEGMVTIERFSLILDGLGHQGNIAYRSYTVEDGWQGWKPGGEVSGDVGEGEALCAVQIMLTGHVANYYDISYRVKLQSSGWQAWVNNGCVSSSLDEPIVEMEVKLEARQGEIKDAAWTLTEYGDDDGRQAEFYTLVNNDDGTLIVIDGGWDANTEQVRSIINLYGGEVDYWFITHYDADHVSAFNNIYADPQGITIGTIYATPLDYDLYCTYARWWDTPEIYKCFLDQTAGDDSVVYLNRDDCFDIAGLNIYVFNSFDQIVVDTGNPDVANLSSLMLKIVGNEDSFLVCGDVRGAELESVLINMYGDKMEANIVQAGHHGNGSMSQAFYEVIDPDIMYFDGPAWLTQSDDYTAKDLIKWCEDNRIETYTFDTAPNSIPFE